mmetsp:Transcript_101228/g.241402  ORF Transcript_101228/g.241402 Transcript_101228/m.241402 type:complete len:341 (-) Transcript_101228:122-1144(-)
MELFRYVSLQLRHLLRVVVDTVNLVRYLANLHDEVFRTRPVLLQLKLCLLLEVEESLPGFHHLLKRFGLLDDVHFLDDIGAQGRCKELSDLVFRATVARNALDHDGPGSGVRQLLEPAESVQQELLLSFVDDRLHSPADIRHIHRLDVVEPGMVEDHIPHAEATEERDLGAPPAEPVIQGRQQDQARNTDAQQDADRKRDEVQHEYAVQPYGVNESIIRLHLETRLRPAEPGRIELQGHDLGNHVVAVDHRIAQSQDDEGDQHPSHHHDVGNKTTQKDVLVTHLVACHAHKLLRGIRLLGEVQHAEDGFCRFFQKPLDVEQRLNVVVTGLFSCCGRREGA